MNGLNYKMDIFYLPKIFVVRF